MSKMDRQLNSKKDKETIYEIYRACRLCGAGAGYKMPIIQNVVDMGDTDVELRQKVRDCVQIEVHQDDKMPPLICELCVDKVNDFYEFLEMCRQTNKRTRLRLGLPPQSMPRGAPDAGECILGLTEPVYVNEDSDVEPLAKQKKLNPKVKVKREPELKVKLEKRILTEPRPSRFSRRAPTPPRMTRLRTTSKDDNMSLSRLKDKPKSPKVTPKSILKKETKNEDKSLLSSRLKRSREKEPVKLEMPTKRVKIHTKTIPQSVTKTRPLSATKTTPLSATKTTPQTPKPSPKSSPRVTMTPAKSPKSSKISPKRAPSPPPPRIYKCGVCGQANKNAQGYMSHMKVHFVGFTSTRLACNPCGLWFASPEEATTHHKHHRNKSKPYTCRRCEVDFIHLPAYDEHFDKNQCISFEEVPDVKCDVCWHLFATNKLLDEHKCLGEDHRPGGKCGKCKRSYALLKNLKKHEESCTAKKKGELIVDPELLGKVRPIQIRVSRCDPLLSNLKQDHYDVSNVTADFGLDKNCVYPYISSVSRLRIKSDPDELDRMVDIKDEFYIEEDYVHWDSEESESDEDVTCSSVLNPKKKVDTLANLSLKTLFSKKCFGKVPKKKRRVKQEKSMFDSLLPETEDDVTRDINNIIDNMGDDDEFDGQSRKAGDESQKNDDKDKSMDVSGDKDANVDDGKETENVVDKSVVDNDTDVGDKVAVNEKNNDNVSIAADDDSPQKKDKKTQNDIKLSDVIDTATEKNENNDKCDDEVSKQDEKDINIASKNFNSVSNDTDGSNNNLSSNNKDNNDDISRIDNVNTGILNNFSFDYDDGTVLSKNGSESKVNDITSSVNRNANQNDDVDASEAKKDEINFKIDFENNQDSNSVGAGSDSLLNDNTQNDVGEKDTEKIDKVNTDIVTSLSEHNTDIDENKSQSNEFSVDNLSQESISALDDTTTNDSCQRNEDVTENDYTNAISVIVNRKSKVSTEAEEMEDSRLMEALDAQIGDGNDNSREQINENSREQMNDNSREQANDNSREQMNDNSREQTNDNSREKNSRGQVNDNFNDKIAVEDMISAKSSDKDMIPEEFNFDA